MGRQASLASHTTGTPVSSPSDDPGSNSDTEDANLLLHNNSASRSSVNNIKTTMMYNNDEAETSFSCNTAAGMPTTVGVPVSLRKSSTSGGGGSGGLLLGGYSNVVPHHPHHPFKSKGPRVPSVIPPNQLDLLPSPIVDNNRGSSPGGPSNSPATTPGLVGYALPPPPPPKGYTNNDSSQQHSMESPILPPLPPLPPGEIEDDVDGMGHPLMTPLDVASLR